MPIRELQPWRGKHFGRSAGHSPAMPPALVGLGRARRSGRSARALIPMICPSKHRNTDTVCGIIPPPLQRGGADARYIVSFFPTLKASAVLAISCETIEYTPSLMPSKGVASTVSFCLRHKLREPAVGSDRQRSQQAVQCLPNPVTGGEKWLSHWLCSATYCTIRQLLR
jgi:hypothetical protein